MNRRFTRTLTSLYARASARVQDARARFYERVGDPERGDVPASVWLTVGMILLAVAVVAAITTVVNNQLAKLPG
jgi:hypothetical protein